jgi:hypothetical protein
MLSEVGVITRCREAVQDMFCFPWPLSANSVMWTQLAILGACVLGTTARFQTPFGSGGHLPAHVHAAHRPTPKYGSAGLGESFTRLAASDIDTAAINAFARQDISSLSQDDFTTLTHPAYPRHGLRLKKSRFCDGKVDAYTGYIDVEARHLFFYFFKSRGDWTKDDVIFVCILIPRPN